MLVTENFISVDWHFDLGCGKRATYSVRLTDDTFSTTGVHNSERTIWTIVSKARTRSRLTKPFCSMTDNVSYITADNRQEQHTAPLTSLSLQRQGWIRWKTSHLTSDLRLWQNEPALYNIRNCHWSYLQGQVHLRIISILLELSRTSNTRLKLVQKHQSCLRAKRS